MLRSNEAFEIMSEIDIDDRNEDLNDFNDNSYGPYFTTNFGL